MKKSRKHRTKSYDLRLRNCMQNSLDDRPLCDAIEATIDSNLQAIEDIKTGKEEFDTIKNFLLRQVIKACRGRVNPKVAHQRLDEILLQIIKKQ